MRYILPNLVVLGALLMATTASAILSEHLKLCVFAIAENLLDKLRDQVPTYMLSRAPAVNQARNLVTVSVLLAASV